MSDASAAPGSAARMSAEPTRIGVGARELRLDAVHPRGDPALGDDRAVPRRAGDELELRVPVDRERREIAGVHADRVGAEHDRAGELVGVVRLDERIHAEIASTGLQTARGLVVEVAKQQEDGVRAGCAELDELVLRREEPLGEQRQAGGGSCSSEVVDAAAEALVDEHRHGRGAFPLEGRRQAGGIGVGPEVTGRRRSALDLGDRRQAVTGERVAETTHQRATSARENATRLSSRSAAAPESTASAAIASPPARSSACPAAAIAPAALRRTASR